MGDWLYKIGIYKILYWVGWGICLVCRGVRWFGSTLKWIWLYRQLQEVIQETLNGLPKNLFEKAVTSCEYDIFRLWGKENGR